ncbi:hypothetical protein ACHAXR_012830 [Thalassiosira sp. AJA248-18]
MDALAGYGSDSDSDEDTKPSGGGALAGLLAHYSDDSDANENGTRTHNPNENGANGKKSEGKDIAEEKKTNGEGHTKKRRRRWDNPGEDVDGISVNVDSVLPPPPLMTGTSTKDSDDGSQNCSDPMMLFQKDYTAKIREKLAQQLQNQSQGKDASPEKQQLNKKLEQLHNKFHQNKDHAADNTTTSSVSSFAAHLKSQHEFGNPHLLKNIIDHFNISPLESHVGNSFSGFEHVDRLMSAEERARIAAANYGAGMGGGALPGPGA